MKIKTTDTMALERAIKAAHPGGAVQHVFTPDQIAAVAVDAEKQIDSLGLAKGLRQGAVVTAYSGGSVAKAYKHSRLVTHVELTRGSDAWFCTSVSERTIWQDAPRDWLTLTAEQDADIVARVRRQYNVAKAAVAS